MQKLNPRLLSGCVLALAAGLALAACSGRTPPPATVAPLVVAQAATATPPSSATASATETAVPTSTATPTVTETPTPTPTATPTLHPMTIAAMRQRDYPGSPVTLEETLEPGASYSRYYASYLSEGLKIYALLTVPDGDPPPGGWPVIIFNHGFIPPAQYRTTQRYVAYVDNLARSGYIVFRSDYRGHDRSEGLARGAYGRPDYTVDVLNAVAAMQQYPAANPDRIGMWGHSMGGYITLRSLVISPDIKAGVIWAGVVASYADLLCCWRGPFQTPTPDPSGAVEPPRGWRGGLVAQYGTPADNPAFWDSISANSYLADLAGPLQLHHGTADASVPYKFSVTLADQLADANQPYEFYTYDGDNHNLSGFFTTAMTRTIAFFDNILKAP